MNMMPMMKTMYALLESMIENCLFFFNEQTTDANESFVPENRKENVIDRIKILKIVLEIRKDAVAKIKNTMKLIPVRYLM